MLVSQRDTDTVDRQGSDPDKSKDRATPNTQHLWTDSKREICLRISGLDGRVCVLLSHHLCPLVWISHDLFPTLTVH